jgi:hypothetical protein
VAVIGNLFQGLPQAYLSGGPLELREVWASKSFLSPPGDPGLHIHELPYIYTHPKKISF